MNKITKLVLVLGVFTLCASAAYYLAFYLPKINKANFLLSMQEKCRTVGEDAFNADGKLYGGVQNLDAPEYAYNQKLNTCVYASGYTFLGDPSAGVGGDFLKHNCNEYWEKWVKNSYTNEEILYVRNGLDNKCQWTTPIDSIDKFNTNSEALLGFQN